MHRCVPYVYFFVQNTLVKHLIKKKRKKGGRGRWSTNLWTRIMAREENLVLCKELLLDLLFTCMFVLGLVQALFWFFKQTESVWRGHYRLFSKPEHTMYTQKEKQNEMQLYTTLYQSILLFTRVLSVVYIIWTQDCEKKMTNVCNSTDENELKLWNCPYHPPPAWHWPFMKSKSLRSCLA